jgi:hypothetical protein
VLASRQPAGPAQTLRLRGWRRPRPQPASAHPAALTSGVRRTSAAGGISAPSAYLPVRRSARRMALTRSNSLAAGVVGGYAGAFRRASAEGYGAPDIAPRRSPRRQPGCGGHRRTPGMRRTSAPSEYRQRRAFRGARCMALSRHPSDPWPRAIWLTAVATSFAGRPPRATARARSRPGRRCDAGREAAVIASRPYGTALGQCANKINKL